MVGEEYGVERMIDALIDREGGYVNHPADKGGPTCFGITEAVARAHGYGGAMQSMPRGRSGRDLPSPVLAASALRPDCEARSARVAAELFDTGVNMGPSVATTFLQRALTALNRDGTDYADLTPDGRIGPLTLHALDTFIAARGKDGGETVLMRALEALQGERYLRLAERRPANEAFLYGWLANRIGTIG